MAFIFTAFTWLRSSWLGKALAIAGGVVVAVLLVFSAGKKSQRQKQKVKNLEEYIDVRKRADTAADQTVRDLDGISDADLHDRLRKHNSVRD